MSCVARELVKEIAGDRSRGASRLAQACLEGIAKSGQSMIMDTPEFFLWQVNQLADELSQCRPSMRAIANQMQRLQVRLGRLTPGSVADARSQVIRLCHELIEHQRSGEAGTRQHAFDMIGEGETLMVHSHSSLVRETLLQLAVKKIRVVVTESLPGGEGRTLAGILNEQQIPVTLVSDSQYLLGLESADRVLVGADAIAADGTVINKVGTHVLALAASALGKPFYVVADTLKYCDASAADISLERLPSEPPDTESSSVAREDRWFEPTPPPLISAWVSELGVCHHWVARPRVSI